jgi:hypothetical protein
VVTALAAAPVRAQDLNISGVRDIPPDLTIPGTLSIGTSAGAGTLNVMTGGNVQAGELIIIGAGGAQGTLIANGGSVTSPETDIKTVMHS